MRLVQTPNILTLKLRAAHGNERRKRREAVARPDFVTRESDRYVTVCIVPLLVNGISHRLICCWFIPNKKNEWLRRAKPIKRNRKRGQEAVPRI